MRNSHVSSVFLSRSNVILSCRGHIQRKRHETPHSTRTFSRQGLAGKTRTRLVHSWRLLSLLPKTALPATRQTRRRDGGRSEQCEKLDDTHMT